MSITEDMIQEAGDEALKKLAANPSHNGSGAALWMLLLLRLTSVATDQRLELRNSAIQTLMRIMSAYGDSLSPEAWSICMRSVIFRLLSSIDSELQAVAGSSGKESGQEEWKETAIVVIQGVSSLFASYLSVLTAHNSFTDIWQDLLKHFRVLLGFKVLDINAAVYSAVRDILHRCAEQDKPQVGKESLDLAWDLWSRGIPVAKDGKDDKSSDNQKCLLVWVEALLELYGLIQQDFSVERVRRMLTLLRDAMQHATPGAYASDIEYVTPLQGKILEVFRMIRTNLHGVPSAMITQVAEFVSLAFAQDEVKAAAEKRTYVAMSKESMSILQNLIIKNSSERDIYETEAFATALTALAKPVILKYQFKTVTRSTYPWQEATKCSLVVLASTLPHIRSMGLPRNIIQKIWEIIILIANGIISADDSLPSPTVTNVLDDQQFDIFSFHQLRQLIIPSLGEEAILDQTRKSYAEGLFRTSIIHAPAPAEASVIYGNTAGSNAADVISLSSLYKLRPGRTIDPLPTKRNLMSEVCLDELFALVEVHNSSSSASISRDGKEKNEEGKEEERETSHESYVRLARTAAPYLILRCALSIRAYVADQPLRGRMPQPLSQRKELTRILRKLVHLKSEPDAIPDAPNVDSETRKHLLRLYPLLISAVQVAGTAGDDKVLSLIREALEVVGGEFGV